MTVRSMLADVPNDVTDDGVFHAVRDGYQAVFEALPNGASFNRIWRDSAYHGQFPIDFAHIGFLTLTEAHRLVELLGLAPGAVLVDVACGAGGPGLWAARQTGATLIGQRPCPSPERSPAECVEPAPFS
ncbi:MAG: SAM-dependent methyltransferase [Acidimicrobiales bacterium]